MERKRSWRTQSCVTRWVGISVQALVFFFLHEYYIVISLQRCFVRLFETVTASVLENTLITSVSVHGAGKLLSSCRLYIHPSPKVYKPNCPTARQRGQGSDQTRPNQPRPAPPQQGPRKMAVCPVSGLLLYWVTRIGHTILRIPERNHLIRHDMAWVGGATLHKGRP